MVPLPWCDGPTLKSFDFQGPQNVELPQHLGKGLRSHVSKVDILGRTYTFEFCK